MDKRKLTALKWVIILCGVLIVYGIIGACCYVYWLARSGDSAYLVILAEFVVFIAGVLGIPFCAEKLFLHITKNADLDEAYREKLGKDIYRGIGTWFIITFLVLYAIRTLTKIL